jgi:fumarate reductase subunit D
VDALTLVLAIVAAASVALVVVTGVTIRQLRQVVHRQRHELHALRNDLYAAELTLKGKVHGLR